jgi:hypothetical protein
MQSEVYHISVLRGIYQEDSCTRNIFTLSRFAGLVVKISTTAIYSSLATGAIATGTAAVDATRNPRNTVIQGANI